MWRIRLLKFAIGIFICLISILTVFGLAPYSPVMHTAAYSAARTVRFATLLPRHDKHCSMAAVWAIGSGKSNPVKERIQNSITVVATDGSLVLAATPAGRFWIPAADIHTLTEELSEQEVGVYGHDVRPGDVVLDCGANVGVYTRVALNKGARTVVAIEITPETLVCLRRNFEREIQQGSVIVYPKGVWDREAVLRLTSSTTLASTANSVALNRGEEGPEVPLTTIDNLTSELRLPRVDFIKMDIEGAESHALMGAARTLALYRPRLAVSMEHKQSDPDEIPALVERLNPAYRMQYGGCGYTTGRVQPEVLFAW